MTNRFTPELALVDPDLADVLRAFLSDPPDCLVPRVPTVSPVVALLPATATPALERIRSAEVATHRPPVETLPPRVRRAAARVPQVAAYLVSLGIIAVPFLAFLPPAESQRPRFVGLPRVADAELVNASGGERRSILPKPTRPVAKAAADAETKPVKRPGTRPSGGGAFKATPKAATQQAPSTQPRRAKAATNPKGPGATNPKAVTKAQAGTRRAAPETKPKTSAAPVSKTAAKRTIDWPAVSGADLYNVIVVRGGKRRDTWVEGTTVSVQRLARAMSGGRPLRDFRWYVYPLYREGTAFRFGPLTAQGSVSLPPGAASVVSRGASG